MVNKSIGLKVLIVPISIALTILIVILYAKPAFDQVRALSKAISADNKQLEDIKSQEKILNDLKLKWQSMADERLLVQTALPEKSDAENYISELYGRASRSGVLITNLSTDSKAAVGAASSYDCSSLDLSANAVSSGPATVNAAENPDAPGTASSPGAVGANNPLCAESMGVKIGVSGSWDQLLSFFKYLEDTNRIANISEISISSSQSGQSEDQAPNDILSANVSVGIYYKSKSGTSNSKTVAGLTTVKGFEENTLKKLKDIIFAPYTAPAVSESGERNLFK